MKILSAAKKLLDPVYNSISCCRTQSISNKGPFISVNVPAAVTNEIYRDIKLHHNHLNLKDYFLNLKPEVSLPERSLLSSNSRETRAKFIRLNCYYNKNVRCIKVESSRANIDIQDSCLSNLEVTRHRGWSLSLMTYINASLRITNSHFRKNKADIGGSLFANSPKGFLKIEHTNVTFSYCRANNGCTIFVGYNRSGPHNLFFGLRNVIIEQNTNVRLLKFFLKMEMSS